MQHTFRLEVNMRAYRASWHRNDAGTNNIGGCLLLNESHFFEKILWYLSVTALEVYVILQLWKWLEEKALEL